MANNMYSAGSHKIFFERAGIKVTTTRFETGSQVFPLKKISGVRIDSAKRHTRIGIMFVALGVALLTGGLLGNFGVVIMLGAALTVGGVMLFFARVNRTLVLITRGTEVNAMASKDAALIQSIASALREAIASRS